MVHIYIFSGLGVDHRVFQQLTFTGFDVTFIQWIPPLPRESMINYARRISVQITSTSPILIGLSFGGMMAIEVAKLIDTKKIILLASAKTKNEIPFYYRLAGKLYLDRLLPVKLIKVANMLTYWLFGIRNAADKQLFKEIIKATDPLFLKWAINKIVNWQNEQILENTFHVHGTSDRILPFRFAISTIPIVRGGHFMTVNRSEELNKVIMSIL